MAGIRIKGEVFVLVPLAEIQDLLHRVGYTPLGAGVLDLEDLVDAEDYMTWAIRRSKENAQADPA